MKENLFKNIEDIKRLLPHRYPFLLVDRVVSVDAENKSIRVLKNITANEPQFQGHFPNYFIMPGVLIIEAVAQAAALCMVSVDEHTYSEYMDHNKAMEVFFTSIKEFKFKKPVVPGDQLIMDIRYLRKRGDFFSFHADVFVGETIVAQGEVSAVGRFS